MDRTTTRASLALLRGVYREGDTPREILTSQDVQYHAMRGGTSRSNVRLGAQGSAASWKGSGS